MSCMNNKIYVAWAFFAWLALGITVLSFILMLSVHTMEKEIHKKTTEIYSLLTSYEPCHAEY